MSPSKSISAQERQINHCTDSIVIFILLYDLKYYSIFYFESNMRHYT